MSEPNTTLPHARTPRALSKLDTIPSPTSLVELSDTLIRNHSEVATDLAINMVAQLAALIRNRSGVVIVSPIHMVIGLVISELILSATNSGHAAPVPHP
jgi:hypothetical protein